MHHGLLHDLALVLLTAGVVTVIFHRLRQPVVLGYILAGVIVGPHTSIPFFVGDVASVQVLSELGVILLMFSLGLHFSLRKLAGVGATACIAALLEIFLMLAIGYGVGAMFGWGFFDSLFLGAILSISSTTIIIKALQELRLTREPFADITFGILIVEDIMAIAMLALLSGVAATGSLDAGEVMRTFAKLSIFLAGVLVIGLLAVPKLLRYIARFRSDEMMLVATLGLCFGVAFLAAHLQYSVALGAFLIGAVIAEARDRGRVETLVMPVRDMFSAIFFTAVGMLIDPAVLIEYLWPIVVITLAVVAGKVVTCALGTFLAGHDPRTSLKVGMSLAQIGEFSFIIASLGLTLKVTSPFLYPIAVAVSAITTLLTPYLIRSSDVLAGVIGRRAPEPVVALTTVYARWMERRRAGGVKNEVVRRLVRKWVFQVVLNGLLAAGILLLAAALAQRVRVRYPDLPAWTGGPNAVVWTAAMLLVLPLLVVTYRKIRAIAVVIAEATARGANPAEAATIRGTIATTIHASGMAAVLVALAALSWAILPPWPVLVVLGVGLLLVLALAWRRFERVYNKAQVALKETFEESAKVASDEHAAAAATAAPMPAVLRDAVLESVEVKPGTSAAGRLIRELQLRTLTGASAVAIDRQGGSVVNPGPDEELHPGDRLLLLGNRRQLEAAKQLLLSNGPGA